MLSSCYEVKEVKDSNITDLISAATKKVEKEWKGRKRRRQYINLVKRQLFKTASELKALYPERVNVDIANKESVLSIILKFDDYDITEIRIISNGGDKYKLFIGKGSTVHFDDWETAPKIFAALIREKELVAEKIAYRIVGDKYANV